MKQQTKWQEEQAMKKMGLAALLASVLMFAVASMGHTQSAEDLAKGQSPGVRYVSRFVDAGVPTVNAIVIRGDELTFTCEEGRNKGYYNTAQITSKRTEGSKVILKTARYPSDEYIIDGFRLIWTSPVWSEDMVYTRE